jgi:molybdopterin-binding protein
MIPGKYNMVCPQGSTFSKQLTYSINSTPVSLVGYTARMQVREKYTSTATTVSITTENGGITLGGVLGTITLLIEAGVTSLLVAKEYVYDLELISGTNVYRIIEGKFIVTPEVTK